MTVTMATGMPQPSQGSSATVPFDRNGVTVTRRGERPDPRSIEISPPGPFGAGALGVQEAINPCMVSEWSVP